MRAEHLPVKEARKIGAIAVDGISSRLCEKIKVPCWRIWGEGDTLFIDPRNKRKVRKEIIRRAKNRAYARLARDKRVARRAKEAKQNVEYLAQVLHSVNKWAKHYRESQRTMGDIIWSDDRYYDAPPLCHYILHHAKDAKEECYWLKERVLERALELKIAKKVGWHYFEDSEVYALCITIGSYSLHAKPMDYDALEEEFGEAPARVVSDNAVTIKGEISEESDRRLGSPLELRGILEEWLRINRE